MKRLLICVYTVIAVAACGGEDNFMIDGKIQNAGNIRTVVLYEGDRRLDSVFLNEQGEFRMRRGAAQPRLFTLEAGKSRYQLILQNGDQVTFRADLSQPGGDYAVSGSPLSERIREFAVQIAEKDRVQAALEDDFANQAAGLDDVALINLRDQFLGKYRQHMQHYVAAAVQFANKHDDLVGFYAMSTLDPEFAEVELIEYADRIAGRWDDNSRVRQLLDDVERIRRLAIGQSAPDFESLTPNNQKISLSGFRGKYTFLDFWASWCVPCREENPNIVRQYNIYKDKGFTVLGVSLDGNPGAWMRAIKEDGLEWTQVSDLQQWGSEVVRLYSIRAIPTSYLLDPQGNIIAKNLRGAELADFLKKTLD